MPYLMVAMQANSQSVYLQLRNNGIGPALIENVQVVKQDDVFEGDAFDYFLTLDASAGYNQLSVDKIMHGRLIPSGSNVLMIGRDLPPDETVLKQMLGIFEVAEVPRNWYIGLGLEPDPAMAKRAVLQIEYSSVYGERWRIRSDSLVPEPL
jgi:hypothetical protein